MKRKREDWISEGEEEERHRGQRQQEKGQGKDKETTPTLLMEKRQSGLTKGRKREREVSSVA